MAVYNQLTLLDAFNKFEKRDGKLVKELLSAITNFKYFRVNVRYTEFNKKKEIEDILSQIIYWTAWVAWKKSKFVEEYRDNNKLDYFLSLTKEKSGLGVSIPLSVEVMSEYFNKAHVRLKTTFMAYKDILQAERETTKRILDYFNTIHNLTYE